MKGFFMTPIFPKLPKGLTTKELREEIQRRMDILEASGYFESKRRINAVPRSYTIR